MAAVMAMILKTTSEEIEAMSLQARKHALRLEPMDPLTMIGTGALLFLVALAAGFLPARRQSRVDFMATLRHKSSRPNSVPSSQ